MGHEVEGDTIVAVALPGRRRAVVEDVALMPLAARAVVFGARQDQLQVGLRADRTGDRGIEARPAGAALVLGLRSEQRQVAAGAMEAALALFLVQRTAAR